MLGYAAKYPIIYFNDSIFRINLYLFGHINAQRINPFPLNQRLTPIINRTIHTHLPKPQPQQPSTQNEDLPKIFRIATLTIMAKDRVISLHMVRIAACGAWVSLGYHRSCIFDE